jgi:signal transduction histidine kinase
MRPVSVHGLIEGALVGAANQLQQHRVLIERDWSEQLPWVLGIGGHLKQVFQDLATNAVEAMPDGGRLMIRTRLEDSAGAGQRVLVEFADSGPGISDSEAHLIFEPFYSNRRGSTGLGLAISYSIVERHGGTLSVSSSGEGTTFRVALPAASTVGTVKR